MHSNRGRKKQAGEYAREIAVPAVGYKIHIGTDVRHGFIRRWCVGDTATRSAKNERHLERRCLVSKIHVRRSSGKATEPAAIERERGAGEDPCQRRACLRRAKGPLDLCIPSGNSNSASMR